MFKITTVVLISLGVVQHVNPFENHTPLPEGLQLISTGVWISNGVAQCVVCMISLGKKILTRGQFSTKFSYLSFQFLLKLNIQFKNVNI